LLSTVVGAGFPAMASPGLGISVSFERADQTDAEVTGSIWAGGEQGSKLTRTILVRSLSDDVTQEISLEIHDQILVNGEETTDFDVPSRISDWVTFSPDKPLVPPGGEVRITMTIEIPSNAADEAFDATLRVMAGAVENLEEIEEEVDGVRAVVGTRLAIDSGMWLGVGDALDLMPNFEIIGVDGVLLEGTKYVRVFFENTGLVPLRLTGRLQLADASFADLVYEPQDFIVPEIRSGQDGYVDVPVQPEIEDGNYRSFVLAQQGGVRKTEVFEGRLVFDDPSVLTIPDLLIRGALLVASIAALVLGYRMFRGSTKGGQKSSTPIDPTNITPRLGARLSANLRKLALLARGVLESLIRGIGRASKRLLESGRALWDARSSKEPSQDVESTIRLTARLSLIAKKLGQLALGIWASLRMRISKVLKKLIDFGRALWGARSSKEPSPDVETTIRLTARLSLIAKKLGQLAIGVWASLRMRISQVFKMLFDFGKAYLDSLKSREQKPEIKPIAPSGANPSSGSGWSFTQTQKFDNVSDSSANPSIFPEVSLVASPETVEQTPVEAEVSPAVVDPEVVLKPEKVTPAAPRPTDRPAFPTPRPAGSNPRPLYPYWYQPPTKGK
jgi:hypothetical protein